MERPSVEEVVCLKATNLYMEATEVMPNFGELKVEV